MKALKSEEINKVTNMSKKKKPGDDKHKSKRKSGDHGKGKHGVKDNPGEGKSGETSDPRATKRKCLFCTQVHFTKKELCPAWAKTCMACGGKNNFQMSSSVSATPSTLLVKTTLPTPLKAAVKPLVELRLIRIISSTQSNRATNLSSVKWRLTRSRWERKLTLVQVFVFCPSATLKTPKFALKR